MMVAPLVQLDFYSLQLLAGFPRAKPLNSLAEGPGGMKWGENGVACYPKHGLYPLLLPSLQL